MDSGAKAKRQTQKRLDARRRHRAELGFVSYRAYLASPLWRRIRREILVERPQCEACGAPAVTAHHRSYGLEILRGKNLNSLIAVCHECHHVAHRDGSGNFTGVASLQTQILRAIALSNGRQLVYDCEFCGYVVAALTPFDPCNTCRTKGARPIAVRQ